LVHVLAVADDPRPRRSGGSASRRRVVNLGERPACQHDEVATVEPTKLLTTRGGRHAMAKSGKIGKFRVLGKFLEGTLILGDSPT